MLKETCLGIPKLVVKGGSAVEDVDAFRIVTDAIKPVPEDKDLLVKVSAVAVNPVDYKVRMYREGEFTPGYDACGVVEGMGKEVKGFKVGDKVYYAGDIDRPGCDAQFHLVDYRIAAHAPKSLQDDGDIASLPLTSLTAYEGLFHRMNVKPKQNVLVVGGAGGVGSMVIQLAKIKGAVVYATASREESRDWCLSLGATEVFLHDAFLKAPGKENFFDAIFCTTNMEDHWENIAKAVKPQGEVCFIDDPDKPVDVTSFKYKSVRICWEFMFTRSMYKTDDMIEQQKILEEIAKLIDEKKLKITKTKVYEGFNEENFRKAHIIMESKKSIGKVVIKF